MQSSNGIQTSVTSVLSRDLGGGTYSQYITGTLTLGAGYTTYRVLSYKLIGATLVTSLRDLTGGNSSIVTPTTQRGFESRVFRIGGRPLLLGTSRVGFAAVYNRSLSNAEEDTIRTFVAKYRLAKYGDIV